MLLTIITFIIVLSVLVFVHEFGHFWVARRCGLRPKEFGFGFPPRAIGYYKNHEGKWKTVRGSKDPVDAEDTIYSINWLPLGGFVNLQEDEEAGDNQNHFSKKPVWQRTAILLAGVTMNILLAAFLISVGYIVGLPQSVDGLSDKAKVTDLKVQVLEVMPDSPAAQAGLKAGDSLLYVNDIRIESNEQIQKIADENTGKELKYRIRRGSDELEKVIIPVKMEEGGKGMIGVNIGETGIVRYPFFIAIWEGFKTTAALTWFILLAFGALIRDLVTGHGVSIEVGGPIRIAEITGDAVRMGFSYLINFSALLSINLAIINALPFPALDGGRVIFLIIEKLKGSPVSKRVEATIHSIGFALLMLLILLVTYQDIARFWK